MTTNVGAAKAALHAGRNHNLASTSRLQSRKLGDEYVLGKKLGIGSYAVVKEGIHKISKDLFAVKIIDKKHAKETRLKSEVALMGQVDHPNCVKLWDVFSDPDKLFLVLDLLTGGTVLDRILEIESFTESQAASVMADVLNALHYLHNIGITHRDLKPENLLYATSDPRSPHYNVIKIVDFGLAKLQNEKSNLQTVCGTPYFIAPEILEEHHTTYGAEVDVWSLGVILYFMLCGFHPFDDQKYPVMFNNIKKGRYSFPSPFWDDISSNAKDYITQSLTVDPAKRPTAAQCMEHQWIKSTGEAASSKLHSSHRSFLLIQKLPIFQRIDNSCLQETAKRLKAVTVPPGDYVCRCGDHGNTMFFVNAGHVNICVDGVEIDRKGIGGFFGEASLVFGQVRIADVKSLGSKVYKEHGTTDPTELFELCKSDFDEVCKLYPELKSRLATIAEANMHKIHKARGSIIFKLKQGMRGLSSGRSSNCESPERMSSPMGSFRDGTSSVGSSTPRNFSRSLIDISKLSRRSSTEVPSLRRQSLAEQSQMTPEQRAQMRAAAKSSTACVIH